MNRSTSKGIFIKVYTFSLLSENSFSSFSREYPRENSTRMKSHRDPMIEKKTALVNLFKMKA